MTILYTALGREFSFLGEHYPAPLTDREHLASFITKQPAIVQAGSIKPNPVKLWEGGLDGVIDGLVYMREGKVTGQKIVYKV